MTNREFYTAIAEGKMTDELMQFAADAITKLDERNAKRSSKPSKTSIENEPIKVAIVEHLTDCGASKNATDIGAAIGVSTQKASALCRQLTAEGKLTVSEGKVKGKGTQKFYAIAAEDGGDVDEDAAE